MSNISGHIFYLTCLSLLSLLACTRATALNATNVPTEAVSMDGCPSVCPRIYDPVCATDGEDNSYKYFHNECLMRYESCHGPKVWLPTRMNMCGDNIELYVRKKCLRPCYFIYEPVCATDGQTFEIFANECIFGMENCFANGKWLVTRDEKCGL